MELQRKLSLFIVRTTFPAALAEKGQRYKAKHVATFSLLDCSQLDMY